MGKDKKNKKEKHYDKKVKKIKKGKSHSISMEKFLTEYCGIENEEIVSVLTTLSHQELKDVCEKVYKVRLITVPFEVANENEYINNGDFLSVLDAFNHEAPYVNPSKKREASLLENCPLISSCIDNTLTYDEIVDILEDNLTLCDMDISGIGSFDLPKVKKIGGKKNDRY